MKVLVYCLQSTKDVTKQDIRNVSLNFDLLEKIVPKNLWIKVHENFPKVLFQNKEDYLIGELLEILRKIYVDFLEDEKDYVIVHHVAYDSVDKFYTAVFEIAIIVLCRVFDYKLIAKSYIFV